MVASVLDGDGLVPLTLECLSDPVAGAGSVTFSVRVTCPVARASVPGRYEVLHATCSLRALPVEVAADCASSTTRRT